MTLDIYSLFYVSKYSVLGSFYAAVSISRMYFSVFFPVNLVLRITFLQNKTPLVTDSMLQEPPVEAQTLLT